MSNWHIFLNGAFSSPDSRTPLCFRLKDTLKQVLHLQNSHTDSASHHTVLQDQMHKLSDKVSQATHFLGGGKGYDSRFVQHLVLCRNLLAVHPPVVADHLCLLSCLILVILNYKQGFPAHDEVGTCEASLVPPKQSVLKIVVFNLHCIPCSFAPPWKLVACSLCLFEMLVSNQARPSLSPVFSSYCKSAGYSPLANPLAGSNDYAVVWSNIVLDPQKLER